MSSLKSEDTELFLTASEAERLKEEEFLKQFLEEDYNFGHYDNLWQCLSHNKKAIAINLSIILFLIGYTVIGGFAFLHFEYGHSQFLAYNDTLEKRSCIEQLLNRDNKLRYTRASDIAAVIADRCLKEKIKDDRIQWSFKSSALYALGILTTLGYGKIEPQTVNGRVFTVVYGFFGIPLTVILLTNFGRYLEAIAQSIRKYLCCRKAKRENEYDTISGSTLFFIVMTYLMVGAIMIPAFNGEVDIVNGIYYAFICLTAIEYGDIVPQNNWFVPISVFYMCTGLAISTIALDIGSLYVRKLHFIGKKLKNIANIRIWFGAKNLEVRELITAVGQNMGIDQNTMAEIDIDTLVKTAIQVKLGRLSRVPQTHMIVEGIWPPELVPLFMKDGEFPLFVDSEDDLSILKEKQFSVHFDDEQITEPDDIEEIEDTTTLTEVTKTAQSSRLSPLPRRESSIRREQQRRLLNQLPAMDSVETNSSDLSQF